MTRRARSAPQQRWSAWAYKLDYDKAIAEDLAYIAQVERHVPLAAVLTEEERSKGDCHLWFTSFLFSNIEQRAPLMGLTETEAREMAWFDDVSLPRESEPAPGWYGRAEANMKRLEKEIGTWIIRDPQAVIKKLRTQLARHRRNKEKFAC